MSHAAVDRRTLLAPDNVTLPAGAGRAASAGLIVLGVLAIAATGFAYFTGADDHAKGGALMAYHIGVVATVAISLGALGFIMALHQTGAGWSAVIRRQFENLASSFPVCLALFLPTLLLCFVPHGGSLLWGWMDAEHTAGDVVYEAKKAYLNLPFFIVRNVIYFAVWMLLASRLVSLSVGQDQDGDRWRTAKARTISAPGLLLFALTTAFAGFDWLMTLDYHFFSTMWGVYFFAIGFLAAICVGTLTFLTLRARGRLAGVFTEEHLHDLGKLIFGFTVFWAYIGFSQYFLIWYANIPEETAWFSARRQGEWMWLATLLAVGKFAFPFCAMLPRPARRNAAWVAFISLWLLTVSLIELFWVVRPELVKGETNSTLGLTWVDFVGPLGPILVYFGVYIRRIGTRPLIPLKEPRLDRSLAHKNTI
jgi:hypothetical protein